MAFKDISVTTQICSMLLVKTNLKQFVKKLETIGVSGKRENYARNGRIFSCLHVVFLLAPIYLGIKL